MSKEAIKLQAEVVNATSKLHSLGFRIKCTYIPGAGWASELVNNNTGENHELDEHSKPKFQDDYQAKLDAEQEKNNDYALDNMTCDDEMVIDDVGQMYDPTERLKMEEENE
jgi:hypothetical protein